MGQPKSASDLPPLAQIQVRGAKLGFEARVRLAQDLLGDVSSGASPMFFRRVNLPHDRLVKLEDPAGGETRTLRMFGSNNYLGLAADPEVRERVKQAIDQYGVGAGGTPVFHGHHNLVRELEARLAAFLGTEDAILFSNGAYGANLGILTALVDRKGVILHDEQVHTSFLDGVKLSAGRALQFAHNDVAELDALFDDPMVREAKDVFVGAEGVYSMEGDLGRLDELAALCSRRGAVLMVDDAHGIGVMGERGAGTAEHLGAEVDITVGTFAKAFGIQGGFVAARKGVVDYLRAFARTYVFSVTVPAASAAAVLAGLDILEREPERLRRLHENVAYTARRLGEVGLPVEPQSPIIRLRAPAGADIARDCARMMELGVYLNPVLYPAVPLADQGFRINLCALHTTEDIDVLADALAALWPELAAGDG